MISLADATENWTISSLPFLGRPFEIVPEQLRDLGTVSWPIRLGIYHRDGDTCQNCGRRLERGESHHLDHIIPRSAGGRDESNNLRLLCARCNLSRGNKYDGSLHIRKLFVTWICDEIDCDQFVDVPHSDLAEPILAYCASCEGNRWTRYLPE